MMLGMETQTCQTCGQALPGRTVLQAIHEAMGTEEFTAARLLASSFSASQHWPVLGSREEPTKGLGRYLAQVVGLQPKGKDRNGSRKWAVDPAFLTVL